MTLPFGLRQLVHLRGDDVTVHAVIDQPGPRPQVGVQLRMAAVHQQQRDAAAGREIVPGQLVEGRPGGIAATRVAVAGQVHQEEGGLAAGLHAIEIGEPCLAGRGARARQRLADQGVDQARLADVRSADHGQLRQAFLREPLGLGRAGDEGRRYRAAASGLHERAPGARLAHPPADGRRQAAEPRRTRRSAWYLPAALSFNAT